MVHPDPTAPVPHPSADVDASAPATPALAVPRVLRRAELGLSRDERLVRENPTVALVLALVILALGGLAAWKYRAGALHWGWAASLGGFCALLGVALLWGWRLLLRPEAWVLAVGPERILVSLRSTRDERLTDDDPHILELPLAHVASARASTMRQRHQARGESHVSYTYTPYVDFRTQGLDLGPIKAMLVGDRYYGLNSGGREHVVVEEPLVRVRLRGTKPDSTEVLYLVGEFLPLEPDVSETGDKPRLKHPVRQP